MRPQLPTADELLPYLRRIDEARYYSNHGQLLRQLETRLATLYKISPANACLVANGTVALSAALVATGARPGSRCLLPSWTFVGSAAAIWAANMVPYFIDVEPTTWMLDPIAVAQRTDLRDVGAVMPVSAFGSPIDTAAWDAFTEQTRIPAIIDGAASFDTVATVPSNRVSKTPIMVSLHATKAFGTGEGGLVMSTDDEFMLRLRQICNFGVWNSPAQILGYNGKLSEYHCAIGHAMLDAWPDRRANLKNLTQRYATELSGIRGIGLLPGYGREWVSCYCNVATENAPDVIERLAKLGIETRLWWKHGVHVQEAYRSFGHDSLPVTEQLGASVFGLPFHHDLSDEDFGSVIASLQRSLP